MCRRERCQCADDAGPGTLELTGLPVSVTGQLSQVEHSCAARVEDHRNLSYLDRGFGSRVS